MTKRDALFGLGILTLAACAADVPLSGSVLLHIDTDAVLERIDQEVRESGNCVGVCRNRPGNFDQLRVEVDGGSTFSSFDVDEQDFVKNNGVSLGIETRDGARNREISVTVTLFRSIHEYGRYGLKHTRLIRRIVLEPTNDADNEAWAFLSTDTMFDSKPVPTTQDKEWSRSSVSSWRLGQRDDCAHPADANEVCIPGGTFWMGDAELSAGFEDGSDSGTEVADAELLTVVEPFIMDAHEVTAAEFLDKWPELRSTYERHLLAVPSCDVGPQQPSQRPIGGVSWELAKAYCKLRCMLLPTEAQFEYVASGMGREWTYPWGFSPPYMTEVVLDRGTACATSDGSIGPQSVDMSTDDVVNVVDKHGVSRGVRGLGGNVAEWVLDSWKERVPLGMDSREDATNHVYKGGSWRSSVVQARAGARNKCSVGELKPSIGFRCVRPAMEQADAQSCGHD